LEYELGNFSAGDMYTDRILETIRQAPSGRPQLEHSIIALTVGAAAHITGQTSRLEIASSAANLILSVPASREPRNAQFSRSGLALIAVRLGDVSAAKEQYSFLESLPITRSPLHLIDGDRVLGLLAQTIGDLDAAVNHFDASLAFCRKAVVRPELAWGCYKCADVLLVRGKTGDIEKARSLLYESLGISGDLDMGPLSARAQALQEQTNAQPGR
jgi:ATP/maltotriose-dependent transcriptional regulator MalT